MSHSQSLQHALLTAWPYLYSFVLLPTAALLGLVTLMTGYHTLFQLRQIRAVPAEIPWIGIENKRFFPRLRATFATWTKGRAFFDEAWDKVISL